MPHPPFTEELSFRENRGGTVSKMNHLIFEVRIFCKTNSNIRTSTDGTVHKRRELKNFETRLQFKYGPVSSALKSFKFGS